MRILSSLLLLSIALHGVCQIESNAPKVKKSRTPKVKQQTSDTTWDAEATAVYLSVNPAYSFRSYTDTKVDLGSRLDETGRITVGVSLGARVPLGRFIGIDVSFSYFQSGEEYENIFAGGDSVYRYTQSYHTIATPLVLQFNTGSPKHRFLAGVGVAPGGLVRHNTVVESGLANNPQSNASTSTEDIERFQVLAIGELGYQGRFSRRWGTLVKLRYYRHLTDTFNETVPFDHKQWGISLNLGLALYL